MKIIRGRAPTGDAERRGATFTGEVWADPVMSGDGGPTVNNVFFTPGARTHWHSHEGGQLLHVTSGSGLVCADGEQPNRIGPGDIVWAPAGERHWHGASPAATMGHTSVSFGVTSWGEAVGDEEYGTEATPRLADGR